jgi:hypothetical protein
MGHRFAMLICQWILILPAPLFCQIVLSEIMFNPQGNERHNEFIELWNQGPKPIDLCGWQLSDGDKTCSIIDAGHGCLLAPKQYAVVLLPDYEDNSTQYEHLIPKKCLRITIDQATFGKSGFANSRNETVSLLSPDSITTCSYTYLTPNPNGFSEEKIILSEPNYPENWGNSKKFNGTPGHKNSISPPQDSLTIDLIAKNMRLNVRDSLGFVLTNLGLNKIHRVEIRAGIDRNQDARLDLAEIVIDTLLHVNLSFRDSTLIRCTFTPQSAGEQVLRSILSVNQVDYTLTMPIYVALSLHTITINEIFLDGNELVWLELLNTEIDTLICKNIKLFMDKQVYDLKGMILPPGYTVIARDSVNFAPWETTAKICKEMTGQSIPESTFLIRDKHMIVDSVYVASLCDLKSIERLNSRWQQNDYTNWQCSMHPLGSTPGHQNCILENFSDLLFMPETWSATPQRTNSDTFSISGSVKNIGNDPVYLSAVELYLPEKERIDSITINTRLRPKDSIQIDLKIELEPGAYQAVLQCLTKDETYPQNNRMTMPVIKRFPSKCLILNEIMPFTDSGFQEWIELYNPSDYTIHLTDWQICDARRCSKISDSSAIIYPGTYCVLANIPIAETDSCTTLLNIPELNNSGDDIVLKDPFGTTIDSLNYTVDWLEMRNFSLERVSWQFPSEDRLNWVTSSDSPGTPGAYNNASPKDWDLACIEIGRASCRERV